MGGHLFQLATCFRPVGILLNNAKLRQKVDVLDKPCGGLVTEPTSGGYEIHWW